VNHNLRRDWRPIVPPGAKSALKIPRAMARSPSTVFVDDKYI